MRCLLVALGLIASSCGALGQEFELPTLRGSDAWAPAPPAFGGWSGFYAGGQVGYTNVGSDFSNNVNDLSAFIVRNTIFEPIVGGLTTLSKGTSNGGSYDWFAGYNQQWEGVILGLEANYNHTAVNVGASDSISLRIANDATAPPGHHFFYDPFTVAGTASIRITDLASFRARAGWVAGQFLPYAFVGLAVARADVSRSATVSYIGHDVPDPQAFPNPQLTPRPPAPFGPVTQIDAKQGAFYYGYAIGIGVEICIMPNVFLRGEWEVDNFQSLRANVNTARTGLGVKF